ncbi:Hypothetical protein LUCI_3421 [Lucifera butyrica]|uniref:Uncharacterized protein n=1 Tax=Lucifera butyrica TaxID=1351585 RepID=A0A498R603_9FIRM|nr:hypothetical protein [Lucifera butyrica]VBB08156.1 Hypothetical protein LUCI_3421 [Lucifera butyrica]
MINKLLSYGEFGSSQNSLGTTMSLNSTTSIQNASLTTENSTTDSTTTPAYTVSLGETVVTNITYTSQGTLSNATNISQTGYSTGTMDAIVGINNGPADSNPNWIPEDNWPSSSSPAGEMTGNPAGNMTGKSRR